jgi:hypothetical protein
MGYPAFVWVSNGASGGGFGTTGGAGGVDSNSSAPVPPPSAGGIANGSPELVPLRGGCEGAGAFDVRGGGGGGAIQFVSGRALRLSVGSVVHVGGGGGIAGALGREENTTTPVWGPGGGGAGGGILVEAPTVELGDATMLLASGGGGGGYGACAPVPTGADAEVDVESARGGACPFALPAAAGGNAGAPGQDNIGGSAGGGGGGLGRIRINTADGQYASSANSVLRGVVTSGTLLLR